LPGGARSEQGKSAAGGNGVGHRDRRTIRQPQQHENRLQPRGRALKIRETTVAGKIETSDNLNSTLGLRRELRWWQAAALSIAGAAPTVSMAFSGPGAAALVGRAAALSFVFAAGTCKFIGYAFMLLARKFNNAGNVYGFVGASLGPRTGFFAGWAMALMYFVFIVASISASAFLLSDLGAALGWWHSANFLYFAIPISALVWLTSSGVAKHSTRLLLYIEGGSVVLITVLMVFILVRVGTGHGLNGGKLTFSVFELPSGVNLHALVLGAIFGFLAFTGFEAAGSLGEETTNPGRSIPRALGTAIVAVGIFFIACIATQSIGFGANKAGSAAFASSSSPLFQLAGTYTDSALRDIILLGAAISGFGAAVSEAVAGSRLVFALARDGAPSSRVAKVHEPSGTPRSALAILMVVDIALLVLAQLVGVTGFNMWQYLGTLGTLAILVGYGLVCLGAVVAVAGGRLDGARWRAAFPLIGLALVGYTLYNELIPAPAWPYRIFPYITAGWLAVGLILILANPGLARRIGTGLTRGLGLPTAGNSQPIDEEGGGADAALDASQ
jgi:amino acid transporter